MPSSDRPSDDDVLAHLPADGRDQSCAVCRADDVVWIHPLALSQVSYREFGKGHTLPTYWCVCGACEVLFRAGDDDELAHRLVAAHYLSDPRPPHISADRWVDEMARKPVAVWRRADLGARPLA